MRFDRRSVPRVRRALVTCLLALNTAAALADDVNRDVRTAAREDASIFIERDLPCVGSVSAGKLLYSPFQCTARGVTTFVYFREPLPFAVPALEQGHDDWFRPKSVGELPMGRVRVEGALVWSSSQRATVCLHVKSLDGTPVAIQEALCWLTFRNSRGGSKTIFADFQDSGRWGMGGAVALDAREFRTYVENFALGINVLVP